MKVAFIIDVYDLLTNGTVMTAHRMVEEFRRNGHEVRVVATGARGEGCYEVPELYIPLVTEVSAKQQIRFAKADINIINKAIDGVDVIYCYLPFHIEKKVRKIAKKRNIPSVAGFHLHPENITYNIGIHHSGLVSNAIFKYFKFSFYRHFDHIHCPSGFIAEQLKRKKYLAKMHVISNGVDPEFHPSREERKPNEKFEILSVGRFASEKRQDIIIKGIALSAYKDKIHLTLAGKGPRRKKLEKLARKYLNNKVSFGFFSSDKLAEIMRNSDLYIHAADVEIEGISCIEAFASGVVPVIAKAKQSATPQFALDERSLFKARSAKDLAEKIDYWIEHEEERKKASKLYAKEGKEKYSLEFMAKKMEEMFSEAISTQHVKEKLKKDKNTKAKNPYHHCLFFKIMSTLWYYIILVPFLYIYLKCVIGLKVCGRKNLKKLKKSGAVSVSNHVHKIDCAMNACVLMPKKVVFTALKSNFKIPVAGKILKLSEVEPVAEKLSETSVFMNAMKELLKKHRIVHFYAEGHLVEYYAGIRDFNKGAFALACEAQVPIIPIVISWRRRRGFYKLFYSDKPCPTITMGAPIDPDYVLLKRDQIKKLECDVKESMEKMYNQSNNGKSVDYYKENGIDPTEHKLKKGKK